MTSQTPSNPDRPRPTPSLHAQDARAIDHLLEEAGQQASATGKTPDAARLAQAQSLGRLLDQWQAENPPLDIKNRTLAKIKQAREASKPRTEPLRLPFAPGKLTEVAAVAAVVLIAFSLAVPMLVRARDQERMVFCQSNLRQTGEALGQYAADHRDIIPRGHANPNGTWWRVGQPAESNSANLYLLARHGYVTPQTMACPDNANAPRKLAYNAQDWPEAQAVSYSYQNQFTPRPYSLSQVGDMVVLADKNPLFDIRQAEAAGLTYRRDLQPTAATRFHRAKGQNILDATGQASWKTDPIMPRGQDNIWLANDVREYRGDESPADHNDTFLVP